MYSNHENFGSRYLTIFDLGIVYSVILDECLPYIMMHQYVLLSVYFYVKKTGHNVAVCNGHTFSWNCDSRNKITERWPCTSKTSRCCKAVITMTKTREIIRAVLDHNHPPPKFVIHKGEYMKI